MKFFPGDVVEVTWSDWGLFSALGTVRGYHDSGYVGVEFDERRTGMHTLNELIPERRGLWVHLPATIEFLRSEQINPVERAAREYARKELGH